MMIISLNDDRLCQYLTATFESAFPHLKIKGGADEPFYKASTTHEKAIIYYRSNYPRSLLHEMSHYCLAGNKRRLIDDFGYWYTACGRNAEEQLLFEQVEARPQGLEKAMCRALGIDFSPSLDDFSGRPASTSFLQNIDFHYQQMISNPPTNAKKALDMLMKNPLA